MEKKSMGEMKNSVMMVSGFRNRERGRWSEVLKIGELLW